jgi:hypothetical protein
LLVATARTAGDAEMVEAFGVTWQLIEGLYPPDAVASRPR